MATILELGVGNTVEAGELNLSGTGSLSEGIVFGNGDTGIYAENDNNLRIDIGGALKVYFSSSELRFSAGFDLNLSSSSSTLGIQRVFIVESCSAIDFFASRQVFIEGISITRGGLLSSMI